MARGRTCLRAWLRQRVEARRILALQPVGGVGTCIGLLKSGADSLQAGCSDDRACRSCAHGPFRRVGAYVLPLLFG